MAPKPLKDPAVGLAALIVIGLLLFVVFFYVDPAPSPTAPSCAQGEVPIMSQRQWWCVQAKKP